MKAFVSTIDIPPHSGVEWTRFISVRSVLYTWIWGCLLPGMLATRHLIAEQRCNNQAN